MNDCLVIQPIAEPGVRLLRDAGFSVRQPLSTDFKTLEPHLQAADAIITRNHGLSAVEIAAAPSLRIIVSHGAGTDAIDKAEAAARQIPVLSTPGANAVAVAEHTFGLILACARQIPEADRAMRSGDFDFRYRQTGFELRGKTIGLVGYGRIAGEVASLAHAFGMRVLAATRYASEETLKADRVELAGIDELCACSDIISLHAVYDGRVLFDRQRLASLKPNAILVNTARGALVDEGALVQALNRGMLRAAAIDVFATEPLPADSDLLSCRNLITTPHIGGSAAEALDRTALEAARAVISRLGMQTG